MLQQQVAVNAQFALYNGALGQLVAGGFISAEEAAIRAINFVEGVNYPIMTDVDLTDVTAILIGAGLDPQTAALLGQLRQVKSDDLVVLTASSVLGTVPDPSNPLGIVGVHYRFQTLSCLHQQSKLVLLLLEHHIMLLLKD